jgi:hypothetical protein
MPLGDIAGSILGGILRIVAEIFVNVVLEILIKGPGHIILKRVVLRHREDVDSDSILVVLTGALFWLVIGGTAYWAYQSWSR